MPDLSNKMALYAYEPSLKMAFSDSPDFPNSHEEAKQYGCHDVLEIEEWQTYYAKFYSERIPDTIVKSKIVVNQISGFLELNFRNFVGLSRIGRLCLNVRNRKISSDVYWAMLDELADKYAGLVFSFSTPVGQHYEKKGPGRDSVFVEYLFLRRYLLNTSPDIEAIGNILAYDPHRKFKKEIESCSIDQCQDVDSNIIPALVNGPVMELKSSHPLGQTGLAGIFLRATGRNLFPSAGFREVKFLSLDTNENRFIKFFLESLLSRVETLRKSLTGNSGGYFNPDISEDLDALHQKISGTLLHNMWREVSDLTFIPINSQVLQRKDGYCQLFNLYSLLQLATRCDFLATDFSNIVEIKDLPTLYEYWCFFQVKAVMDTISSATNIIRIINEGPLEHELSTGLCIEYQNGSKVFFNKSYPGSLGVKERITLDSYMQGASYSHNYRPDIVIESEDEILIFDAKYKGKRSGFYGSEEKGVIEGWKDEDIDKMHCYHDAIQGVMGSFILYPGVCTIAYPVHKGKRMCEGVGAVSLKPGSSMVSPVCDQNLLFEIITSFLGTSRKDDQQQIR